MGDPDRERTLRRIAFGLGIVVAGGLLVVAASIHMIDFAVYRAGAQAMLRGTPLYEAHPPDSLLPFTYTPFAALVFVLPALLPPAVGQVLFTAASLAALLRASWLLAGELREARAARWSVGAGAGVIAATALLMEPTQATLAFGQINLILLWLVLEDTLDRRVSESPWAGVLTGLAAALKLTPGIFVLYWAGTRRYRAAAVTVAVFLATVALGAVVQPASAWAYWTDLAYDPARLGGVAYVGNQSLNGLLHRAATSPGSVWYLVGAGLALACAWLVVRRSGTRLIGLGAVSCAMLIASPISWTHHWVWMIPVLVALAAIGERWSWTMAAVGLALSVTHVVRWSGDVAPGGLTPANLLPSNAYLLWAAATLAAVAVWSMRRTDADRGGRPRATRVSPGAAGARTGSG